MLQILRRLFGLSPKVDYKELLQKGAVIVDVRSKGEYQDGHIKGSLNVPLDTLSNSVTKLKKEKPLIICCASGMRSASAKAILKSKGFDVHNGGGWMSLQNKIS